MGIVPSLIPTVARCQQYTPYPLARQSQRVEPSAKRRDGEATVERRTQPGSPLTQSVVDRGLKALLAKAGLPELKFHELRHTAYSLMALQGVPATVAMKRMGHSDIRFTLQRYTNVLEQQDKDAAARLDALLA